MRINRLMKPAIYVMNKLPFKLKIIVAISILFVLLVLPSREVFTKYIYQNKIYQNQLIGLSYNQHIEEAIKIIQLHRGLSNAYLNGNKILKKKIEENEKDIDKIVLKLKVFDENHLNQLKYNKYFVDALSNLTIVKIGHLRSNINAEKVFKIHTHIINNLIKTVRNISKITSFSTSDDLKINYLGRLLEDKLLQLQENSGKIRGVAVGVFLKKNITNEEKSELLKLYTLIKSLESNILENQILTDMDSYFSVQKKTVLVSYKLNEVLDIVNKNIITSDFQIYDHKKFFKQATEAIDKQVILYNILSKSYEGQINILKSKIFKEFIYILIRFLLIIAFSLYIITAFYISIVESLKKLQIASNMIAEGKTDIHLKADTKDEIGNALLAFNNMSQKLDKNISFLDGYKMAIDETSIVSKTDKKGIITYVNKKFCEISGFTEKDLVGMSHNIVRHRDMSKEAFKDLWQTIKSKKVWHGIVKNRKKDGGFYIVDATIIPVLDSHGEIIEYIGVRHDVTELEKSKEEIKKQKIDLLTGLPNRSQLLDDLKVSKKPILFYLNIDDFSDLNDFYGATIADQTLVHIGKLLKEISKNIKAKLYKLHADEFALFFDADDSSISNYKDKMGEIIEYIESRTVECDSQSCVSINMSGGVSSYDIDKTYINLLSYAITARKKAKIDNKKFLVYSNEMNRDSDYKNNIEWINKIKEAIVEDRLTTYFQPIIDNTTGAITKYESLVRMIDKDGKAISPFFFLDIAKKAKLYTKIIKIVIDKSFATFEKLPQYDFSLNITVEDITDEEISSYIFKKLKAFPHPEKVILEITESEEIKDYGFVNKFITKIKGFGAKIAIDDFGSGYANFEHIISLNVDFIKIDGTLIKNIDKDKDAQIITEAIIAFSKKLGSKTVVEFVHSEEVYEKVKEMGADFSQGFHLGEPRENPLSMIEFFK